MIKAIGMPGQMPRQWAEGSEAFIAAQVLPGETTAVARLGDDGRPVAEPLPTEHPPGGTDALTS